MRSSYGHLAHDAEDHDRDLIDAYDVTAEADAKRKAEEVSGHVAGTEPDADDPEAPAAA